MKILKIGRLLKTDKEGFIVSESSVEKIVSPWLEVVGEVKQRYIKHLGNDLHSIYVRGSVARGGAIEGISDIDTIAVMLREPQAADFKWGEGVERSLKQDYPFSTGAEIYLISYHKLFEGDEMWKTRFIIKTQSACVAGEDLAKDISTYKANLNTASHLREDFKKVFENTKKSLSNNPNKETVKWWCRWAMKRIIRGGFVLIMDREQAFSRDLYPCYKLFSKYFPDQEPAMEKALDLAINPTSDANELINFLDNFGVWIVNQQKAKFSAE